MLSSKLQENPPSGSSSEGEEDDSHGEEEELTPLKPSSSTIPIPNSNSIQTPTSVTQSLAGKCNDDGEDDSTSTDDDDESGSDSNDSTQNNPISPSSSPALNIKPISSKPMTETHKPKKPDNSVVGKRSLETDGDDDESGSDSDDSTQNNPIKPISSNSVGKRSLETDGDEKDSRKEKKMKKVEEDHEEKKSGGGGGGGDHSNSKKLWTEQDEIDILKGMIDFKKTKGDPAAQVGAFFDFLKYDHLRSDFSKQQLQSKIRTLKRKYTNTLKRAKQPGEDPQISKPHEAYVYKLSKKVWLGEVTVPSVDEKSKQKSKNVKVSDGLASSKKVNVSGGHGLASCEATVTELPINSCENPYLKQSFVVGNNSSMLPVVVPPVLGHFLSMGNTRLDLIESCNANELDNKWKNVMIAETEAYIDRLELVKEQTKMMLDKLKSSN